MKRIIIVDDDPGVQEAYKMIFATLNYEVIVYSNGDIMFSGEYPIPDLFILDKQLSGIDGLDICKHLKGQSATSHIPVIMLSASPKIHRLAPLAGADDAMEKPFSIQALREMIRKHLVAKAD